MRVESSHWGNPRRNNLKVEEGDSSHAPAYLNQTFYTGNLYVVMTNESLQYFSEIKFEIDLAVRENCKTNLILRYHY